MSCTENDSGPYVVFFLPAVVGCLTILLARRWANSQVSNTSSTAISRRRKIIKDPLVKRPLPPIACKMVAPGSKKTSGASKKVLYTNNLINKKMKKFYYCGYCNKINVLILITYLIKFCGKAS